MFFFYFSLLKPFCCSTNINPCYFLSAFRFALNRPYKCSPFKFLKKYFPTIYAGKLHIKWNLNNMFVYKSLSAMHTLNLYEGKKMYVSFCMNISFHIKSLVLKVFFYSLPKFALKLISHVPFLPFSPIFYSRT